MNVDLLAIFNHYDVTHPFWPGEDLFLNEVDLFVVSLDRYGQEATLEELYPAAMLCDSLLVPLEMVKSYPTVFFISDQTYYQLKEADETRLAEGLEKIRAALSHVTMSKYLAAKIQKEFGITASCQAPTVIHQPKAEPKYIYYDYNFKHASQLQAAMPREEFRQLSGLNDLGQAKLYIATPPADSLWWPAIAVATYRSVPVVSHQCEGLDEFTDRAGLTLPHDASKDDWLRAIKTCLRERNHIAKRVTEVANKYRDMSEMNKRIREALRSKPTRIEMLQLTKIDPAKAQEASMQIINQRRRRMPIVPPAYQTPGVRLRDTIFLSGGIGDIFAVEGYFTDEQRMLLKTILYGTHKHHFIRELFEALPNYPHLKNHVVVWDDFSNFWCFCYKEECLSRLGATASPELLGAEDWGIIPKFPLIGAGLIKYNGSSFLKYKLTDISKFMLPMNYIVIQPYSTDKRNTLRDFTDQDWLATTHWLKKINMKGVIINKGDDKVPDDSTYINLANQTSVLEAIEILKASRGYVGIDSWLTVLATKLFDDAFLAIKCNNGHCYDNKHIYFAPKRTFSFLGNDIAKILK